jgi:excisionase family DNA binding protein
LQKTRENRRSFREVRPVNERQAKRFAEEPELISIRATQALLGDVSDKTVRRLVKAGRIEAVKVGTRIMPRLASVRSFARGG